MSRLRWPESTNSVSEKPGTIHTYSCPHQAQIPQRTLLRRRCRWFRQGTRPSVVPYLQDCLVRCGPQIKSPSIQACDNRETRPDLKR